MIEEKIRDLCYEIMSYGTMTVHMKESELQSRFSEYKLRTEVLIKFLLNTGFFKSIYRAKRSWDKEYNIYFEPKEWWELEYEKSRIEKRDR